MGKYVNSKYGPAAVSDAGGGGGGTPLLGTSLVTSGYVSWDVNLQATLGGDPCADPFTNCVQLRSLLSEVPADATAFQIITPGGTIPVIGLDDYVPLDITTCGLVGTITIPITIMDGTSAGASIEGILNVTDAGGICACP